MPPTPFWETRARPPRIRQDTPVIAITRLRLDAALYEPVLERAPGKRARSALKEKHLPTLEALLNDPKAVWNKVTFRHCYGRYGTARPIQSAPSRNVLSGTAVRYHRGRPIVPLRWVLVRDPQGRFKPQALLCTNLDCTPAVILSRYAQRWSVEVTFREMRARSGVETLRQWNDKAITRTTPLLLSSCRW